MRKPFQILCALALLLLSTAAFAGERDPLFLNMTTDDPHRSLMAIGFGAAQLERGHPLTIFLNDKGVLVGSKKNAARYAEQQKMLSAVAAKGALVLMCPTCSKAFGVPQEDFVAGARLSSPDLTGPALFRDGGKTLSW